MDSSSSSSRFRQYSHNSCNNRMISNRMMNKYLIIIIVDGVGVGVGGSVRTEIVVRALDLE